MRTLDNGDAAVNNGIWHITHDHVSQIRGKWVSFYEHLGEERFHFRTEQLELFIRGSDSTDFFVSLSCQIVKWNLSEPITA